MSPPQQHDPPVFRPILHRYRIHRVYNRFPRWRSLLLALHPRLMVAEARYWPIGSHDDLHDHSSTAGTVGARHLTPSVIGDALYDDPHWIAFREQCIAAQRQQRQQQGDNVNIRGTSSVASSSVASSSSSAAAGGHRHRHHDRPLLHVLQRVNRWHVLKASAAVCATALPLWLLAANAHHLRRQWMETREDRERHKRFERQVQYLATHRRIPPDFPVDRDSLLTHHWDEGQDVDEAMRRKVAQVALIRTLVERAEEHQLQQSRTALERMALYVEEWRKRLMERYNALLQRDEMLQRQRQMQEMQRNPQLYRLKMQRKKQEEEELERIKLQALAMQYENMVAMQQRGDVTNEKTMRMVQEEIARIEASRSAAGQSQAPIEPQSRSVIVSHALE